MELRPLRSDQDHAQALAEIERLWNAAPGTSEHDRLEVLALLVNAYEDLRWPIEPGDPVEAIEFQMEQAGHTRADLAKLLGSRSRASEILSQAPSGVADSGRVSAVRAGDPPRRAHTTKVDKAF